MTPLRDLANGLPAVLGGQILLVACSVFYLIWWTVVFAPDGRTPRPSGALFLAGAAFAGLGGLVLLVAGIVTLLGRAPASTALTVGGVLVGGILAGAALIALTAGPLQRPLTSELPLIVTWATVQLATCAALAGAGHLAAPAASGWIAIVVVATLIGLGCYLAYYRLDPVPSYWVGMVPLAVDGLAAAAFGVLVLAGR